MSRPAWILLIAFGGPGCGCGASGGADGDGGGTPRRCNDDADCEDGERCAADGYCHPGDEGCLKNEIVCADRCCDPTESCFEMTCLPCPTAACGDVCCPNAGDTCVREEAGEVCCPGARACEGVCCGEAQSCLAGTCVDDCGELARCGEPGAETCCDVGDVCYLGECTTPGALQTEDFDWYVVADDDGTGDGDLNECHEDNNQGGPVETGCPGFG